MKADLRAQVFNGQGLLASASENKIYFGGYTGDGIGASHRDPHAWEIELVGTGIGQIEAMLEYDATTTYVGS